MRQCIVENILLTGANQTRWLLEKKKDVLKNMYLFDNQIEENTTSTIKSLNCTGSRNVNSLYPIGLRNSHQDNVALIYTFARSSMPLESQQGQGWGEPHTFWSSFQHLWKSL